jgi:hypothetical protein
METILAFKGAKFQGQSGSFGKEIVLLGQVGDWLK